MSDTRRKVVLEFTIEMAVTVGLEDDREDYYANPESVLFYFNESSHCLGTEIQQLAEEESAFPGHCTICHRTKVKVLRDATPEDIARLIPSEPEDCACYECRKRRAISEGWTPARHRGILDLMGDWRIAIDGMGSHDNDGVPEDADRLGREFVALLKLKGHHIKRAAFETIHASTATGKPNVFKSTDLTVPKVAK